MTKEEIEKYTTLDIGQCKWWVNHLFNIAKEAAFNANAMDDAKEIESAQDKIIKVLEQQLCGDAISREEANKLVDELARAIDDQNRHYPKRGRNIAIIARDIERLPSVTPTSKWTKPDYDKYPETYPEPFQEVWETDEYGSVIHKAYGGERNIIAWMPFVTPEPYKESKE